MIDRSRICLIGLPVILLWLASQSSAVNNPDAVVGSQKKKESGKTTPRRTSDSSLRSTRDVHHRGRECGIVDQFFANEVWAKVGERTCLKCHNSKGDASDSTFLLRKTKNTRDSLSENRAAFLQMARAMNNGKSRLLLKAIGGLEHGGGTVIKVKSTAYNILTRFVRRANGVPGTVPAIADKNTPPFFQGIAMMSPRRLLRRVTLSLAARLPTKKEIAAVDLDGLKAIDTILERVMKEEAFYERLQEAFNDILLTRGYDDVGETVLSFDHFKTRQWYKKRDPGKLGSLHPKKRAYYKLVGDYREALRREPFELITHIVRNNRPFTEIVTADYIMVSPYTARGYGVFDSIRGRFKNTEDPFEFIPARIPALKHRNGRSHQKSETGWYPHAGLLSTFQYLRRYPTTETNRNRLRVRMYFQHFLGVDIMQLAPRVSDAAAVSASYKIPTMQAADCVVCHKVIDPIAGLLQDYHAFGNTGVYGPRKNGWYNDMFPPGLEGERIPEKQQWRSLQWLGERIAKDPRFPIAMVEHVWYILMGRKTLEPPDDIDDPRFTAWRRAYLEQRTLIEEVAKRFRKSGFNLKTVFKALVVSEFYRVDAHRVIAKASKRRAELKDIGLVRLLTPEQLERKIAALFGTKWGRLDQRESKFRILYGGIDSKAVTERITDPSGAMGAIQRIMANEVACRNVALDFSKPAKQRRLFPDIELSDVPGDNDMADAKIRRTIAHLHQYLFGRKYATDHPEVQRTYRLFAGIITDAKNSQDLNSRANDLCARVENKRLSDPHYTLRAWRAVVTYLLRQHDFLYE